jgi:hypothetical protein
MGGRKENPVARPPLVTDSNEQSGSKFRRKLSQGLLFISNRKTTPGRQPLARQTTAPIGAILHSTTTTEPCDPDHLLSLTRISVPYDQASESPAKRTPLAVEQTADQSHDPVPTPKPLPRSRTMSYIPRPNRSSSGFSPTDVKPQPNSSTSPLQAQTRVTPTKIPSPSPPLNGPRRASPRQYAYKFSAQQAKHIGAGAAFANAEDRTPSKSPVKSYTTSNLIKGPPRQPQRSFMIPRKPTVKSRSSGSPVMLRPSMKENAPTGGYNNRRTSQVLDKGPKRESLMVQTTASNRRSVGGGSSLTQGKQTTRTTPSIAVKRLSSGGAMQAPLTAKRVSINKLDHVKPVISSRNANGSSILQARLMGPVSPSTPTPNGTPGTRVGLPRASTEKDLRKITLGTPSGRGGGAGTPSRSLRGPDREVRLPHSSTFHHLPRIRYLENAPPVPPIPEKYRTPPRKIAPLDGRNKVGVGMLQSRFKAVSDSDATAFMMDEDFAFRSSSPFVADLESPDENITSPLLGKMGNASRGFFGSGSPFQFRAQKVRRADANVSPQVVQPMPPIWWAGRFQARFDQWRTEAMRAENDPTYQPDGPLGQCKLDDEKTAACSIFLQLRALCGSPQVEMALFVSNSFHLSGLI